MPNNIKTNKMIKLTRAIKFNNVKPGGGRPTTGILWPRGNRGK